MRIRDVWQRFVTGGADLGTSGTPRRTFLLTLGAVAVVAAFINTLGVISTLHANPHLSVIEPVIWEGASWITLVSFFWIAWVAYRLAPPHRLSWRLLLHLPALLAFAVGHIGGFVLLCKAAYFAMGRRYEFAPFWESFFYSLGRDALAYAVFMAAFAFTLSLLRQQTPEPRPLTFDIRDGTKLNRVMIEAILAVTSAGNYAEFVLRDGRRLCMRSPLSALERELAPYGFVRTHRSWLVNAAAVTALNPEGSGDYSVCLGAMTVPLSRRFPDALARLRRQ
jgi:DNA-binding LytR/AlgR family response regulator